MAPDEVDGKVVGGPERGRQGSWATAGDPGDVGEGVERRAQHRRIADLVYAAAARAPGQLGVLPRGQLLVPSAAELRDLFDDHRACRHIDAESEGLGGEHDLHERLGEAGLDRLPERWHHAGVVGRHTCFEPGRVDRVAEHRQVLVGQGVHVRLDDRSYA